MSTSTPSPNSSTGTIPPPSFNVNTTQYAVKKRRRPKNKKTKDLEQENAKSNPSKRHRDRLNKELEELAQLIPLSSEVLEKLDKLSILRLVVSYLRNKSYHSVESARNFENEINQLLGFQHDNQIACLQNNESNLALQALHGFLIVVSQDFNIFYVTETVQDYLGFPQCDMMNLSMLDFVHVDDRDIFMRQMRINQKDLPPELPEEGKSTIPEYANMGLGPDEFEKYSQDGILHRSFICRLRCLPDTSSGFLALHFTGHLRLIHGQNKSNEEKIPLPPEMGLFLLASPLQSPSILEIRTKNLIFRTKHKLDYTPLGIDAKGKLVLGYSDQLFRRRSGYEFIHSADMMHCADAHTKLMRLGESGYTVFRLLHKDNHWVWVTASARLVYKNGRPDCIIATQRPIQDQEGEEHMKKRSNAFRFDFTGQAILYGEINPIGTKGGPENNPLLENFDEEPPSSKRQRLADQGELDRKSLYGAQAMQRMDIYMGNLPNQSSDIYASRSVHASAGAVQNLIKNEQVGDNMGPLSNESNVTFFPIGTDVSEEERQRIMKQRFRNPINMQAPETYHQNYPPPNLNRQLSDSYTMAVNPQEHLAINDATMIQPSHNNQFQNTINGAQMQQQNLKRSYPSNSNRETEQYQSMQKQKAFSLSQNVPAGSMPTQENLMMQKQMQLKQQRQQEQFQQSQQQFQQSQQFSQSQQLQQPTNTATFKEFANSAQINQNAGMQQQSSFKTLDSNAGRPPHVAHQQYREDLQNLTAPIQHFNNPNLNNQGPSVIDAMTINSVLSVPGQQADVQLSHGMDPNMQLSVPNEFDEPQFVGSQNNTIRFDLDKIASVYQCADPLSKVKEYMEDNPAHAMAIAAGLVPEPGMPKLFADNVKGYMARGQIQQPSRQLQHPHSSAMRQVANYPPSNGSSSNSDLLSSCMGSEGEASYRNPSVCSTNSMSTSSVPAISPMRWMDELTANQYNQQYQRQQQQQ